MVITLEKTTSSILQQPPKPSRLSFIYVDPEDANKTLIIFGKNENGVEISEPVSVGALSTSMIFSSVSNVVLSAPATNSITLGLDGGKNNAVIYSTNCTGEIGSGFAVSVGHAGNLDTYTISLATKLKVDGTSIDRSQWRNTLSATQKYPFIDFKYITYDSNNAVSQSIYRRFHFKLPLGSGANQDPTPIDQIESGLRINSAAGTDIVLTYDAANGPMAALKTYLRSEILKDTEYDLLDIDSSTFVFSRFILGKAEIEMSERLTNEVGQKTLNETFGAVYSYNSGVAKPTFGGSVGPTFLSGVDIATTFENIIACAKATTLTRSSTSGVVTADVHNMSQSNQYYNFTAVGDTSIKIEDKFAVERPTASISVAQGNVNGIFNTVFSGGFNGTPIIQFFSGERSKTGAITLANPTLSKVNVFNGLLFETGWIRLRGVRASCYVAAQSGVDDVELWYSSSIDGSAAYSYFTSPVSQIVGGSNIIEIEGAHEYVKVFLHNRSVSDYAIDARIVFNT